jgi:predicted HTH transcriptional regulator
MMDIQSLQAQLSIPGETPNVEFKGPSSWNDSNLSIKIIRTILALANTRDGGRIFIGVDNSTHGIEGLSAEQAGSFDVTTINQRLEKFADPAISCEILKPQLDGKTVVVIDVREFLEIPILCKKATASPDGKEKLRRGAVYIRNSKAETVEVTTEFEMRDLINRSVNRSGAALVRQIDELFSRHSELIGHARAEEISTKKIKDRIQEEVQTLGEIKFP